ncbi:hypothetical protein WJX75_002364 [Coccomyxa subellipsoidea]|uniref:Transmembrane protein n=1 Tax=Coccomyxa subellipsoidea TaxID=248742 RepID=A0ABR2YZI2_9CHLO
MIRTRERHGAPLLIVCIVACAAFTGTNGRRASPSPSLLSLLPAIMEVLNKENQSGSSGRSLNISVSAMGPNAPSNGDPGVSGNLANTKVEAGPRSVDVQVTVDPVINIHGNGALQQQPGSGPQLAFLPPKPPGLPANSTVPLQVADALLAAFSSPPTSLTQQTQAAPTAAGPQLTKAGASPTLPSTSGSFSLANPQARSASTDRNSGHYPFNWAVVIAAISSTATFMLLIVLLLAFASGFLPHRRRRSVPSSPPTKTPLSPPQTPVTPAAANKRKSSGKGVGLLGHRLSSWPRPRKNAPSTPNSSMAPESSCTSPVSIASSASHTPNSETRSKVVGSATASPMWRFLSQHSGSEAPISGPVPMCSPFANTAVSPAPRSPQKLRVSFSGDEPPAANASAEPIHSRSGDSNCPLPIVSPFANQSAPGLDELIASGGRGIKARTNTVLPAFSRVCTGLSDGRTSGSPSSGTNSLETHKRLSMIIQQAL